MTRRWHEERPLAIGVWTTFALVLLTAIASRSADSAGQVRILAVLAVIAFAVTLRLWWTGVWLPRVASRKWAERQAELHRTGADRNPKRRRRR